MHDLRATPITITVKKFADVQFYRWSMSRQAIVDGTLSYEVAFNRDIFDVLPYFRESDPEKLQAILLVLHISALHEVGHLANFHMRPDDTPRPLSAARFSKFYNNKGQEVGEAGYAMEEIIFGGIVQPIVDKPTTPGSLTVQDLRHLIIRENGNVHKLTSDACTVFFNAIGTAEMPFWDSMPAAAKQELPGSVVVPPGTVTVRDQCATALCRGSPVVKAGKAVEETNAVDAYEAALAAQGLMLLKPPNEPPPPGVKY